MDSSVPTSSVKQNPPIPEREKAKRPSPFPPGDACLFLFIFDQADVPILEVGPRRRSAEISEVNTFCQLLENQSAIEDPTEAGQETERVPNPIFGLSPPPKLLWVNFPPIEAAQQLSRQGSRSDYPHPPCRFRGFGKETPKENGEAKFPKRLQKPCEVRDDGVDPVEIIWSGVEEDVDVPDKISATEPIDSEGHEAKYKQSLGFHENSPFEIVKKTRKL